MPIENDDTTTDVTTTDGSEQDSYNEDADVTDTDTQDEWVPPTRDDYERLLADKAKVTEESIKRKKMLRDNGIDLATGKRADGTESTTDAGDTVSKTDFQQAVSQVKTRERRLAIEVPTALEAAGWNGRGLARIHKLLELDVVEIDEDGDISGLTEQIEALKVDIPEFFKRTRTNTAPAEAVGAGKKQSESSGSGHWADSFRREIYGS
ncbi:hypothetical protein QFZ22_003777 [Streptomyces canus]|uniref:Scaffolding protein n=1 Tax=Streptomyces canus TaxID=58343 RepID=A0AAW8FFH2_9ACTN|nr:hypothetical protein [Streptomyces canus]MDQ0907792.1 hypothetical protein [Streptomyces canus]